MHVLITGGAGYIGSHAALGFRAAGHTVVVLDDLSTGIRALVPTDISFVRGNVGDKDLVAKVIRDNGIEAVVHFAGSIVVPESVADPLKYYENNVSASRTLVHECVANGVQHFIFSSTATVYGIPTATPITEGMPLLPVHPYGKTKLITEWMLNDVANANDDFNFAVLRYFNVAGADPLGRTGQSTPFATHLIKVACQAAIGARTHIDIFGEDYETPDGTCIRDYIHVSDLIDAHILALNHLQDSRRNLTLNCGYGRGYSVREVVDTVAQEAGIELDIRSVARRPGDVPSLVADPTEIRRLLNWQPKHDDLAFIVRTALDWERALQQKAVSGYHVA